MRYFLPLVCLLLCGCAAIQKADRANTERLLAAAGFTVMPANTPQRQASLQKMIPYKVQRKLRGDEVFYTYACPDQSLTYIGNQQNYSKYRELQLQQEISEQNAASSQNAFLTAQQWNDWNVWGPCSALPPPRMGGRR